MAIIGKIRDKSWLILIVIGGALVTFIFTSQGPGGGSGPEEVYGIGTLYGEKVDRDAFNKRVEEAQQNAQDQKDNQNRQQGKPAEKAPSVDRRAVWQTFVQEEALKKEYEALGIRVNKAEFNAYLYAEKGFSPLPELAKDFTDSITNKFDAKALQSQIERLSNSPKPELQKQWETSKKYFTEQRQKQKYLDIIGQGVYVTDLEAKDEYYAKNETKSVSYIVRRYSEIDDSKIKVTDKKLKAYFNKHKSEKKYENKQASRTVRFADLNIAPSKKDIESFNSAMELLKTKFSNTAQKNDSLFVIQKSEIPLYYPEVSFYPTGDPKVKPNMQAFTYPVYLDTVFKNAQIGDVVGPYVENGSTRIAKVIAFKDTYLSARHILISAQRADTVAVEKAQITTDSIMALINKDNFEQFVKDFSADPGSKDKGGKYEDFLVGEMVPEFSDFAMDKPIGEIGYVQTDYGFHIMEALDRKPANVPSLAIVQQTLKPSEDTKQEIEDDAYTLLENLYSKIERTKGIYNKLKKFDTIVKHAGSLSRPITIQDNSPTLQGAGITSSYAETEIFKLAFNEEAKVGDILSSPIKDGNRWLVAIVASIKVKGETQFEDVRDQIKADYIKDVKYKRLKAPMKGKLLETLAKSDPKYRIQNAELVFETPTLGGSNEAEIVGYLFAKSLKDGKMIKPAKGNSGVIVVRLDGTTKVKAAKGYETEKNQIRGNQLAALRNDVTRALIDQAEVVDNGVFYDAGIRR